MTDPVMLPSAARVLDAHYAPAFADIDARISALEGAVTQLALALAGMAQQMTAAILAMQEGLAANAELAKASAALSLQLAHVVQLSPAAGDRLHD